MRREQDSRIYFGHAEEWCLAREMVLAQETLGDDGVEDIFSEQYCFALNDDCMLMAPGELAELHEAIHEMLRMAEQHWDALTDGAGEPDPAPDEAELRGLDLAILRGLDEQGEALLSIGDDPGFVWESNGNRAPYTHHTLNTLAERGLVMFSSTFPSSAPNYKQRYRITSAGRARLDAQTPEAESEPAPDEALVLNRAEKEILRALAHGDALWLKNDRAGLYGAVASVKEANIKSLWDARLIGPGDEPANMVDGMEDGLSWYTISVKGRRALAAQVPS